MNNVNRNTQLRKRIKIRARTLGSSERPRLSVFRSNNHIYVQAIDDANGKTLTFASSLVTKDEKNNKVNKSIEVGKKIAENLKKLKINSAVFDRNGYIYHGRVKAIADSVRENGINI
jgi:large subunit ribosomal protein L18